MRKIKPVAFLSIILASLLIISATASSKVKNEDLYTVISGDASNLNSMNMINSNIFTGFQVQEEASEKEIEETRKTLNKRLEKQNCFEILKDGKWIPMTGMIDKEGYYLAVDKNDKYKLKKNDNHEVSEGDFVEVIAGINEKDEVILNYYISNYELQEFSNMRYTKDERPGNYELALKGSKELSDAIKSELKFDRVRAETEKIDRVNFIAQRTGDIVIATNSKKSYVLKKNLEKKECVVITSFEPISIQSQTMFFEKENMLFLLSYDVEGNLVIDTFDTDGKNHKRLVKKDEEAKNFVKTLKLFEVGMVYSDRYIKDGNINIMYITNEEDNIFKYSKYTITKDGEVKLIKEDSEKFMERAFVDRSKMEKHGFINTYADSRRAGNKLFISVHQTLMLNSSTWNLERELDFLYDFDKEEITFIGTKRADQNTFIVHETYIGVKE